MSTREFRSNESYVSEGITRSMVPAFLRERGFREVEDQRKAYGRNESQTILATTPDGNKVAMQVRVCWHRAGSGGPGRSYSAAQLLSNVKNNKWEETITQKLERARSDGTTHLLVVQREAQQILYAALIPISEVLTIWCLQRDVSLSLIAAGKSGLRKKNHAMNGSSPTLWLEDDRAPEVAAALWTHPGVRDIAKMSVTSAAGADNGVDDTFDDLSQAYSKLGSDGSPRIPLLRSEVKRDPRVRAAVLERARGTCERERCGATRDYPGFLDVHHILGAERSDRVWNCVAVCPNCHREAHVAPGRETVNAQLLIIARRSKVSTENHHVPDAATFESVTHFDGTRAALTATVRP